MDDIRDSFSRAKKKIKHRLAGSKRKPDRTGAGSGGERSDSIGSLPRPELRVVASGGHDQEGNRANADDLHVYSTDQGKGEVDIGGGEFGQGLHSDFEAATGSGRGGEVERIYLSTPTPQIPSGGGPDGM